MDACKALNKQVGKTGHGCVLQGIHLEGPCISQLGALLDPAKLRNMSKEDFEAMLDEVGPHLKVMTISPSQESSRIQDRPPCSRIKALLKRGIVPAIGHDTDCTEEDILECLRVGSTPADNPHDIRIHMTHGFNVNKFHHRDVGLSNFAFLSHYPKTEKYLGIQPPTVEFIGDGQHINLLTLQAALDSRNPDEVCFITDAMAEPIPGKEYKYSVVADHGECTYKKGTKTISGSCTNLHRTL